MESKTIIGQFRAEGDFLSAESYGNGHINTTEVVRMRRADGSVYRLILQRINRRVFADPEGLMENIMGVTQFLKRKIDAAGGDPLRETLTVIPTRDGRLCFRDGDGEFWRVYLFIEGATSYDACRNPQDFYNCGLSFGRFQRLLADYDTGRLTETIPHFHDTVRRFEALKKSVCDDRAGRAASVREEIAFAMAREQDAGVLVRALERGELPYRVTHNDTKLNNIMIDDKTGEALCVIDLDTVMPGAACYDFGDSIRFGASTAAEDETDLSRVALDMALFRVFADGYLRVSKEFLTPAEARSLAVGAKMMTFECGIRFLNDYLDGDVYFKTDREHHNLDRCRTQFRLVADMEAHMEEMQAAVQSFAR